MYLYLIKQNVNNANYTYDSAVVVATSEEEARTIHPTGYRWVSENERWDTKCLAQNTWSCPENVEVQLIGTANSDAKAGDVILASFNAE
jgi:acetyl/propionyl-CoA carboxylase alpha subunit